jgi:membrane protease YdiL (CAAX protease family)
LTPVSIFRTSAGELRAPWRVLLFLVAIFICRFLAFVLFGPIVTFAFKALGLGRLSNQTWTDIVGIIGGTYFCLRVVDKRPWSDVCLDARAARPRFFVEGFVIGTLAIGIPVALLIAGHWLAAAPGETGASWAAAAARVSVFLLPAALGEELIIRGYVFGVLRERWGWRWTLIVTSVVFGLLHLQNAGANIGSLTLVMIAGLFLGGVLMATRSLYAAWMAHFAWNWTMAVLFHTAVSGLPMEAPGYRYVDAGPDWATGGVWGPEGGIPAGLGMGLGTGAAYFLARRRRRTNEGGDGTWLST